MDHQSSMLPSEPLRGLSSRRKHPDLVSPKMHQSEVQISCSLVRLVRSPIPGIVAHDKTLPLSGIIDTKIRTLIVVRG